MQYTVGIPVVLWQVVDADSKEEAQNVAWNKLNVRELLDRDDFSFDDFDDIVEEGDMLS